MTDLKQGINPITFKAFKTVVGDQTEPEPINFTLHRLWFTIPQDTVPDSQHGGGVSLDQLKKVIIGLIWQKPEDVPTCWRIDIPEDRLIRSLQVAFPNGELTDDWPPKDKNISHIQLPEPTLITGHKPVDATKPDDKPLEIVHLQITRMFAQNAGTIILTAQDGDETVQVMTIDEPYFVRGLKFLFPNRELEGKGPDPREVLAHADQVNIK